VVSAVVAVICASVLIALAAVSVAQADWVVAGTNLGSTTKQAEVLSASGGFTLESKISGVALKITASGLECASAVSACSIDGSSFGTNHGTSALKFTGATVVSPASCEVTSNVITTRALTDQVIMAGGNAYDKFFTDSGPFAEFTFEPPSCPLHGISAVLKGTVTPRIEPTGVELLWQPLRFSTANQMAGGGVLALGTEQAVLSGEAIRKLTTGQKFDVTE
jgi:hypothetical protein